MDKGNRPLQIRAFNCICSLVLICALVYILVAGLEKVAAVLIVVSIISAATPVVYAGGNVLEMFVGFFFLEALLEGIMLIVEGVTNILSSIFG